MNLKYKSINKNFNYLIIILIFSILDINANDTTLNSLFDRSIEELINQEVTIATKSTQKLNQTPSVVSVITAEEIQAYGFRDLYEVLKIIPGFEYSQIIIGTKIISSRGAVDIRQGGRFLIMLDGQPYNGIMYGSGLYLGYEFNMEAIKKIEVIRGPGSALYGRNAFSGVINIITKNATEDKSMNIGAAYGSFNSAEIYTDYSINKEKFNAYLSAKYLTTDGTNSKYKNGFGGENIWNITHDNIYYFGNAQYKNLKLYTSYTRRNGGTTAPQYFATKGNNLFNNLTYNIVYSKNIFSNIFFSIKTFGKLEKRIQDLEIFEAGVTDSVFIPAFNIYSPPIYMLLPEGQYALATHSEYMYGSEIEFKFKFFRNNNLMIGFQADLHGVKNASALTNYFPTAIPTPIGYYDEDSNIVYRDRDNLIEVSDWIEDDGHQYKNIALYLQDIHYITDKLGITVGARFDLDSEIGSILNPRLGMVWEMFPFLSFKALYGEAYRAPTTSEQYKVFGYDRGNNYLDYEEIKTTEFVLTFSNNKLISQVSVYNNNLDNIILSEKDSLGITSYYNTGRNISQGIEFENKFIVNKSLQMFFNYDYKISDDIMEENKVNHPNISNHIAVLGLNCKVSPKLNYSGTILYNGPTEKYLNPYPLLNKQYVSEDKVGDYFLLNSSIQIKNIIQHMDISIYGYNLLNTKFYFQDDVNEHQPVQPKIHFLIKANYYLD